MASSTGWSKTKAWVSDYGLLSVCAVTENYSLIKSFTTEYHMCTAYIHALLLVSSVHCYPWDLRLIIYLVSSVCGHGHALIILTNIITIILSVYPSHTADPWLNSAIPIYRNILCTARERNVRLLWPKFTIQSLGIRGTRKLNKTTPVKSDILTKTSR